MRRTSIKRTRMKPGKRKTKYASRVRDVEFMLFVKSLPCLLAGLEGAGPCSSVVEADHAGDRGIGQKCPDNETIPLCSDHHLARHSCTGFFRKREDETYAELKQRKREWRHARIEEVQAQHAGASSFEGVAF